MLTFKDFKSLPALEVLHDGGLSQDNVTVTSMA